MDTPDNSENEIVEVEFDTVEEVHFVCPTCGMKNKQETEYLFGVETECDECGQPIELKQD